MRKHNNEYLGRGIRKSEFQKSLREGNLKKMLEIINADNNLDVQIRKEYLNVYYCGGNIVKVNSEKSIGFDMYYYYLQKDGRSKKDILNDENIVNGLRSERDELIKKFKEGDYRDYFNKAQNIMDKWFKRNPNPERSDQHKLSLENQYGKSDYAIIDLEYQVSTKCDFACTYIPAGKDKPKNPRFDIIAVNKAGKLCVIELKKGVGALSGPSGLKEHWNCYKNSIDRNPDSFREEMEYVLKQKQEFKLLSNKIKIVNVKPEFMFAYAYDEKNADEEQDTLFQNEYEKIGEKIHVIKIKSGSHKLLD